MKRKAALVLGIVLTAAVAFAAGAYASGGFGTQSDPLVSMSYLTDVLTPEVVEDVTGEVSFQQVTLRRSQTLSAETGCEIVLRSGTAECAADGLIDSTDAQTLEQGDDLEQNHLYLVADGGKTLLANGAVKLLVKGGYTIK